MSVRQEFFTVDELSSRVGLIVVNCKNCSHRKVFYATELTHLGAGKRKLSGMTFHCRNCGRKRVKGLAYVPFSIR